MTSIYVKKGKICHFLLESSYLTDLNLRVIIMLVFKSLRLVRFCFWNTLMLTKAAFIWTRIQ